MPVPVHSRRFRAPARQRVNTPSGFGWTTYGFNIQRFGKCFLTDLIFPSLAPAVTNTWYVDPNSGNDGTAIVNDRTHPLLNLPTGIAKTDGQQVRVINLAADFIGRTTKSWNNTQPTVSMGVIVEGAFQFISAHVASATIPTWVVDGTFADVFETTIAAPGSVIDTAIKTYSTYVDSYGYTRKLPNNPHEYATYTNVASIAAVHALPGSWFHDGTKLYVRTLDDHSLVGDTKIIPSTSGNNGRFGATVNGLTLYVEGIDFVGGSTPFLALTAAAGNTGNLYLNRCSFQGSQTAANGLSVQGKLNVGLYRCSGYYNKADGPNYHSFEADGTTAGTSPTWFEIECASKGNGTTGSAGTSDNATTSHDFSMGIRVGGVYANSDDRVTAETNSAQSWMLGCTVGQAIKTVAGSESIAALISAKVWLDTCVAVAGANPRWIAANSATLNHYRSGAVVNAGTAEATGTVAPYAG